MKINSIKALITAGIIAGSITSCKKNTILTPNTQVTTQQVYGTPLGYKQALAKVYGSVSLTGNQGPSGQPDLNIPNVLEGGTDFFQMYWYVQELPTDEAVIAWGDTGVPDLHALNWSSSNPILEGIYYRSLFQITLANDFIRQSSDALLKSRGITSASDIADIHHYVAEARFLRAYQYWVLMDLFAKPPFVTDADAVGSAIPKQTTRTALFTYIESELKAIDPLLVAPMKNVYGRVDEGADWALLARLYLNAEVYTGTARYADAVTYSKKVIDAGYSLINNYQNLYLADNKNNVSENIFSIEYDGANTQTYGGTTFLDNAEAGGGDPTKFPTAMPYTKLNVAAPGWAGIRTTSSLVNLFPAPATTDGTQFPGNGNADTRAQFWYPGQSLEINDITQFTQGIAVVKFRNVTSAGKPGSNITFSDEDMVLFRLSEQYLIYAEATLRGGTGGQASLALTYVNNIRTRAYAGSTSGNITASQLTTQFILDERARELYWEGFRRTDLIRYGLFTTGTYLWPFKGGAKAGTSVPDYRNIYPIPDADRAVNPNLTQNQGY